MEVFDLKAKTFIRMIFLLSCALILLTCSAANKTYADFVFISGKVYTVNDNKPWAEAMAVSGSKIIFVGSDSDAKKYIGKTTKVIDLNMKLVLPGFIDSHVHPAMSAALASGITIKNNSSINSVLKEIRQYVAEHPEKQAYFGFGWDNNLFSAKGPTKELLDEISSDKPMIFMSNDGHAGWMNTAAIKKAGITKDFPDPVPGISEFIRDSEGNPIGAIKETATMIVISKLGLLTAKDMEDGAKTLFQSMSRYGITSVFDAGTFDFSIDESYKLLNSMVIKDELPFRYFGSYLVANDNAIPGSIDKLSNLSKKYNSDRFRVNTLKLVTDGTAETRKAAFFEPYLDTGIAPDIVFDKKKYHDIMVEAASKGFNIHIHAIGDKAVYEALEVSSAVRLAGYKDTHITICHVQVWRDEDRKMFKDTNVFVNFTGSWIFDDPKVLNFLNKKIYNHQFRYKVLADDGVIITQGSDFPAADTINPLENIEMSHTRMRAGAVGEKAIPSLEESLPLDLAIKTCTINGAKQMQMENKIGSIEAGKYADIIVLEKNIFEIKPNEIHSALPVFVMMNGKIRYNFMKEENMYEELKDESPF